MQKLDRNSPLPLHYQLKQHLLEMIQSGRWQANDMIPSEQELQETFGLSRITVRQALSDLVYEGLLIRERGRGTFVAPPKMTHSPLGHKGLTEFMLEKGIKPGWKVLDKGLVSASAEVAASLNLPVKTKVMCIRRLRLAEGQPIGHHTAYLPEEIALQIDEAALVEGGSLHYIAHLPQVATSQAARSIEAVAASELDVKLLNMTSGSPVLLIQRVVTAASGEPLELLQARYRGDRFKYQIGD